MFLVKPVFFRFRKFLVTTPPAEMTKGYIYTHTHTYTHTHMYINVCVCSAFRYFLFPGPNFHMV
jgi:hypothetical protein